MSEPIVYPCGCTNAIDPPSGVLRSQSKCAFHRREQRDPATLDAAYYAAFGLVDGEGNPRPTNHVAELVEALGPLPLACGGLMQVALEIGCGVSPYVGMIREAGYIYNGLEPSKWAARWMSERHGVYVSRSDFESVVENVAFDLILAAHCLEHMVDAPAAVAKMARLLEPGGELWIVIPHGEDDPVNPDHLVFLTPETLARTLTSAGLAVEKMATRRHVAHERFIYCRARKPS